MTVPPEGSLIEPETGMILAPIPGGRFAMGDLFGDGFDNEQPVHEVRLDPFYLGVLPVTQAQWQAVMGDNPSTFPTPLPGVDPTFPLPVETVSFLDVLAFLQRLNQLSTPEKPYRLPTEAEWEYAARSGGKEEKWAGCNTPERLGEYVWYDESIGNFYRAMPVGIRRPNGLGLHDMSGNVWEYVADAYEDDAYTRHEKENPCVQGPDEAERVIRGGAWYTYYWLTRTVDRSRYGATYKDRYVGFRVARDA